VGRWLALYMMGLSNAARRGALRLLESQEGIHPGVCLPRLSLSRGAQESVALTLDQMWSNLPLLDLRSAPKQRSITPTHVTPSSAIRKPCRRQLQAHPHGGSSAWLGKPGNAASGCRSRDSRRSERQGLGRTTCEVPLFGSRPGGAPASHAPSPRLRLPTADSRLPVLQSFRPDPTPSPIHPGAPECPTPR